MPENVIAILTKIPIRLYAVMVLPVKVYSSRPMLCAAIT